MRQAHLKPPLLEMRGICKQYGTTVALDRVDLTGCAGEIHAILGENGAGKSTLMNILSGMTMPDSGAISLRGSLVQLRSPAEARAHSIAMVHQHFTLVPAFTAAENFALDVKGGNSAHFSVREAAAPIFKKAEELGWVFDPEARVRDLPVGVQQRMEIVRALATGAEILVFDEPTAVLAENEIEELFAVLRRLKEEGRLVLLIAHKLTEIMAAADRVTVLRKGKNAAVSDISSTNVAQLAAWMVQGSEVLEPAHVLPSLLPRRSSAEGGETLLKADKLVVYGDRGEAALRGVSMEVRAGEVLGIGGVDGNGQTELAEALAGLRKTAEGSITWKGGRFLPGRTLTAAYIPQDRRRDGLAVNMTIEENLLFEAVKDREYRKWSLLRRHSLRKLGQRLVEEFDIRTSSMFLPASSLSGGNQQKIIVARALYRNPEWIVALNPTRGLDIGAARYVHTRLLQARERGASIVLISTDLDELRAVADRAAILSGGRLSPFSLDSASSIELGLMLGGAGALEKGDELA